jgi:hypothetical protein
MNLQIFLKFKNNFSRFCQIYLEVPLVNKKQCSSQDAAMFRWFHLPIYSEIRLQVKLFVLLFFFCESLGLLYNRQDLLARITASMFISL